LLAAFEERGAHGIAEPACGRLVRLDPARL